MAWGMGMYTLYVCALVSLHEDSLREDDVQIHVIFFQSKSHLLC